MRLPLGFVDESQFAQSVQALREAAAVGGVRVGIRGSAATGSNSESGDAFGPDSDLDFFIVSDALLAQAVAAGARSTGDALRVGATQRFFPTLSAVERSLSQELGRKVTVRIFGRAGYDSLKSATDILAEFGAADIFIEAENGNLLQDGPGS